MADATRPVKLLGKLPKGSANGLDAIYDMLRSGRGGYAIVSLGQDHVKRRVGMPDEPVAFVVGIEGCSSVETAKAAEKLMERCRRERTHGTGAEELPLNLDEGDEGEDDPADGDTADTREYDDER
jgi:hypothetical protein